jgi:hypothetical protein
VVFHEAGETPAVPVFAFLLFQRATQSIKGFGPVGLHLRGLFGIRELAMLDYDLALAFSLAKDLKSFASRDGIVRLRLIWYPSGF